MLSTTDDNTLECSYRPHITFIVTDMFTYQIQNDILKIVVLDPLRFKAHLRTTVSEKKS